MILKWKYMKMTVNISEYRVRISIYKIRSNCIV